MSENNTEYTSEEAARAPMELDPMLNPSDTNSASVAVSPSPSSSSVAVSGGSSSMTSSVLLNFNERAVSTGAERGWTSSEPSVSEDTRSSSSLSRHARFPLAMRRNMSDLRRNYTWNHSERRRLIIRRHIQATREHREHRENRLAWDNQVFMGFPDIRASSTASSEDDENEWSRIPETVLARVPTRGNSVSDCSQCSSDPNDEDESHQDLDEWLA
ncbi:GL26117 [Drosophila persimilis]|uniref:GL26117 n=1 Tax=Drosophila persimilis TaxID=7234 RepID=B4GUK0_DROPE|nr:GL26117 [Drosophila persimilis]